MKSINSKTSIAKVLRMDNLCKFFLILCVCVCDCAALSLLKDTCTETISFLPVVEMHNSLECISSTCGNVSLKSRQQGCHHIHTELFILPVINYSKHQFQDSRVNTHMLILKSYTLTSIDINGKRSFPSHFSLAAFPCVQSVCCLHNYKVITNGSSPRELFKHMPTLLQRTISVLRTTPGMTK